MLYNIVLVLPYINMNTPWVYTCSQSWTPPPTSLFIPSLWVIPVHQPQASCILRQTWTGDLFLILYMFQCHSPKSSPSPSPTESKRLFYTSVSLLLSRIQGYRYHLSKFHIYALVYCIGVFLSGFSFCIISSKDNLWALCKTVSAQLTKVVSVLAFPQRSCPLNIEKQRKPVCACLPSVSPRVQMKEQ